jgi:hypothetical protein
MKILGYLTVRMPPDMAGTDTVGEDHLVCLVDLPGLPTLYFSSTVGL